jgi:isopentenyl phosphate kinase
MTKVILIKLGGSLITDKNKPYTVKAKIIKNLVKQIKFILAKDKNTKLILGNGAGSFGHYSAQKYNIKDGIKRESQKYGFSVVQNDVKRLNQIVVGELLRQKINAVSIHPSSIIVCSNGKPKKVFLDSLLGLIKQDITPVIYGDIVYDAVKGSHIFSTEDLFKILIDKLHNKHIVIEKVIYLTTVDGVLDTNGRVIKNITNKNYRKIKKGLYKPAGFDVTGGMRHKLDEALKLTKRKIKTHIGSTIVE